MYFFTYFLQISTGLIYFLQISTRLLKELYFPSLVFGCTLRLTQTKFSFLVFLGVDFL